MGRKTWFNIPENNQSLKDRINIILNRELKEPPQGAHFLAKSLDDALELIEDPELTNKVDVVWIVGGSSVYKVRCQNTYLFTCSTFTKPSNFLPRAVSVEISKCLLGAISLNNCFITRHPGTQWPKEATI